MVLCTKITQQMLHSPKPDYCIVPCCSAVLCAVLQPDICCLQEVDDKVFAEFLQPHLALAGWAGHFTNKQGRVREGSALFWRTDKWACAAVQDVKLRVRWCGA